MPEPVTTAPVSVVVLGSSTASGWNLDDPASESWVARYAAALDTEADGSTVINLAVPGFTTVNVLPTDEGSAGIDPSKNITAALVVSPDAIVVNLPSNDASFGIEIERTMENLHAVVDLARDAGVVAFVTTSQPRALDGDARVRLEALRTRVLAEFDSTGQRALDFWTPVAAADGTILPELDSGDGIHLNAAGQGKLADVAIAEMTAERIGSERGG